MLLYKPAWLRQFSFLFVSTSPFPANKRHLASKTHKRYFSPLCFKDWDVSSKENKAPAPGLQATELGFPL